MSLLFVALDSPLRDNVYSWVRLLDDLRGDFGYKLNLDFIVANGLEAIRDLPTERPIFADMKMWNGVRTMGEVCRALQMSKASFTNVYLQAGSSMLGELVKVTESLVPPIKLLGLTVLTHYDNDYCLEQYQVSMKQKVSQLAESAVAVGLSGIIVPGSMLEAVASYPITKLVPAVRPLRYVEKRGDQKQTISVREAIARGADMLVCGSPITRGDTPRSALEEILGEIRELQ